MAEEQKGTSTTPSAGAPAPEAPRPAPAATDAPAQAFGKDEEAAVMKRLQELGYVE